MRALLYNDSLFCAALGALLVTAALAAALTLQ